MGVVPLQPRVVAMAVRVSAELAAGISASRFVHFEVNANNEKRFYNWQKISFIAESFFL